MQYMFSAAKGAGQVKQQIESEKEQRGSVWDPYILILKQDVLKLLGHKFLMVVPL